MRLARQKGRRGHDLARLAIAALDNLPSNQGFWILAPTAVAPIASRHRQWRLARSVRLAAFGVKAVWPYKNPRFVPLIGKADTRP